MLDVLLGGVNLTGYFGVKGGEQGFLANELNLPDELTLARSSGHQKALKLEVNML